MSEWISVKERLPESEALLFCRNSLMTYQEVGELPDDYRDGEVTHWMPLPEPPSESLFGEKRQ